MVCGEFIITDFFFLCFFFYALLQKNVEIFFLYPNIYYRARQVYLRFLNGNDIHNTKIKKLAQPNEQAFLLKSGDYLSSRRLTASTFGVKELNFCVRNGNRWILFAIITAMVIYLCASRTVYIRFLRSLQAFQPSKNQSPFPKINNYIANLRFFKDSFHITS